MEVLLLIVGLVVGFLLGYVVALQAASGKRATLEANLARAGAEIEAARTQGQEKVALLNEARGRLEETFKALAGETLHANSQAFIALARSQMETLMTQADGNLNKRREAIEKVLAPMGETLKRYEENLRALEKSRVDDSGALRTQIDVLRKAKDELGEKTASLVNALQSPQTRGRWGELTLHRAAELAGMAEHCDFSEQVSLATGEGLLRPDMVVHLPSGREIVVDSKVSLKAYLEGFETADESRRQEKMREHARQVRAHMERLASKEYGRQFRKAPDFTVLFLPGEPFFGAASQHDPELFEDALRNGIVVATPMTLIALLRVVAYGWQQASLEENARKISDAGRELYDRTSTVLNHLSAVGGALRKSVESYNRAVASINTRFIPQARRLKELNATSAKDLSALESLAELPQPALPEAPDESECAPDESGPGAG